MFERIDSLMRVRQTVNRMSAALGFCFLLLLAPVAMAQDEPLGLKLRGCPERSQERLSTLLDVELRTLGLKRKRFLFAVDCGATALELTVQEVERGTSMKRLDPLVDDRSLALALSEAAEELSSRPSQAVEAEDEKEQTEGESGAGARAPWRRYWGASAGVLFSGSGGGGSWSPVVGGSFDLQRAKQWEVGLAGAWGAMRFQHPDAEVRQSIWWLAPRARWGRPVSWGNWFLGVTLPLGQVNWDASAKSDGAEGNQVSSFWGAVQGEVGLRCTWDRAYLGATLNLGGVFSPATGWIGDEEVVAIHGVIGGASLGGGVFF